MGTQKLRSLGVQKVEARAL